MAVEVGLEGGISRPSIDSVVIGEEKMRSWIRMRSISVTSSVIA